MLNDFDSWVFEHRERLASWGSFLVLFGGVLFMLAAFGNLYLSAMAMMPAAPQTLAELGLPFPTWFVPETPFGFFFTAYLMAVGAFAFKVARKYEQILERM